MDCNRTVIATLFSMFGPILKRKKDFDGFNIDMLKRNRIFVFTNHGFNWTTTVVNLGWNICDQTVQGRSVFTVVKFFESDKAKVSTRKEKELSGPISPVSVSHYLFAGRVKVKRPCPLGPSQAIRMLNKAPNHPVHSFYFLALVSESLFSLFYLNIGLVRQALYFFPKSFSFTDLPEQILCMKKKMGKTYCFYA